MKLAFSGLPGLWDVKGWLKAILSREPHPLLQFIRYGIAGVLSMIANLLAFWFCFEFLFGGSEAIREGASVQQNLSSLRDWIDQMRNDPGVAAYVKANSVAFVMANIVAYVLNFKWVFQSGRHSRHLEIILFFSVSLFAFVLGTLLASVMVGTFGINEYVAKISDVFCAILINYLCRKFLVFQN